MPEAAKMGLGSILRRDQPMPDTHAGRFVIIIVNSIKPYCYELNNILALPDGFSYRFRYKKTWIPTISEPRTIEKNQGLVILRDFDTGRFYPIRHIYIYRVIQVADIYYIGIQFRALVDLSSDDTTRMKQIESFNELVRTALGGYENPPGADLQNLIFFGPDVTYSLEDRAFQGAESDRDANRWGNIVKIIDGLQIYQDIDFYRVVSLQRHGGGQADIIGDRHAQARYRLHNRASYTVQVLQRTSTGKTGDSSVMSPRTLRLRGEPENIEIVIGESPITGNYDIYPLLFRTASKVSKETSFLLLEVIGEAQKPLLPSIQIPVEIRATTLQVLSTTLALATFIAGVIGLFFPYVPINILSLDSSPPSVDLVQKLSILALVLSTAWLPSAAGAVVSRVTFPFQMR